MQRDFIRTLGHEALDSRLKRISDRMAHDIRKMYREIGLDIEPNWYLLFLLLKEEGELSIAEIAGKLNFAHPSVVSIVKKMIAKGYLQAHQDIEDKRKQLVSFTNQSTEALPEMEKIWEACSQAISEMLDHNLFVMDHLDRMDEALGKKSFYKRYHEAVSGITNT